MVSTQFDVASSASVQSSQLQIVMVLCCYTFILHNGT